MTSDGLRGGSSQLPLWLLLPFFLLVYGGGLIAFAPADRVARLVAQNPQQLPPLAGTLTAGALAGEEPHTGLNRLEWSWQPAALLEGALGFDLRAGASGGQGHPVIRGQLAFGPDGTLRLVRMQVRGRVSELISRLGPLPLLTDARVSGRIERLVWGRAGCVDAGGALVVEDLSGMLADRINALGPFRATPECADRALRLRLESESGQLEGTVELQPDGRYRVDLQATPTGENRPLFTQLGWRRQGSGYRLQQEGRLW